MVRSCRRRGDKWLVAMNKWQDITDMEVCKGRLLNLSYRLVLKHTNRYIGYAIRILQVSDISYLRRRV